jgi:DNA repair protein RecO (recombination protein O)
MPAIQSEALLLRSVDFGESDRIVHFLTRDHGRLTAIAKGARRSRRRFPGTLDVFNRLTIEGRLKPRASMAFLERARLIDAFLGIRVDLARYALASFLVEMLDRLSPEGLEGSEATRLYDFAVESLELIGGAKRPDARLRVWLELRALDALGLRPEFGRCVRCGRPPGAKLDGKHRVSFFVPDGGIVCTACGHALDGLISIDLGTLRKLEEGMQVEAAALADLDLDAQSLAQAERLVFRFQRFHVGVELRSERFLAEMLSAAGPATLDPGEAPRDTPPP